MLLNDDAHAVEVTVEEGEDVGRGQLFAQSGEVPQIAEEDGHDALLAAELQVGLEQLRGDLR